MLSNKEIIVPNNLLNAALKKKGVKAGIVNAGKPLPMLSVQDAVNENLIEPIFIGDSKEILKCAEVLKWDISKYEIINEFRHDNKAYTQGLEFYDNVLYESTGLNGKSSLRKVNYRTGEVLKSIKIDNEYFAEGITILNDKIYQLTWKNQIGFIYNTDLEIMNTFEYGNSIQGWGLCNDGEYIYKSDGTNKIWLLDKDTLEEISYIEVMTNKSKIKNINELEYINGKIYANTYQLNRDVVIIINPKNGTVEGVIDFTGIRDLVKKSPDLDVMNGIAYNPKTDRLYVTGKNWDKLFEIQLVENN